MKFGNLINSIHRLSARVQGALLSFPAHYETLEGDEYSLFVSTSLPNDIEQYSVINYDAARFTVGEQYFTLVLDQQIDGLTPKVGDKITCEIGGVLTTRFVTKNASGKCWDYVDGKQKCWIYTTTKRQDPLHIPPQPSDYNQIVYINGSFVGTADDNLIIKSDGVLI